MVARHSSSGVTAGTEQEQGGQGRPASQRDEGVEGQDRQQQQAPEPKATEGTAVSARSRQAAGKVEGRLRQGQTKAGHTVRQDSTTKEAGGRSTREVPNAKAKARGPSSTTRSRGTKEGGEPGKGPGASRRPGVHLSLYQSSRQSHVHVARRPPYSCGSRAPWQLALRGPLVRWARMRMAPPIRTALRGPWRFVRAHVSRPRLHRCHDRRAYSCAPCGAVIRPAPELAQPIANQQMRVLARGGGRI